MLDGIYQEMTSLSQIDSFCRDHYVRTGEYMKEPTVEEVKTLLQMWGKLDHIMAEEDLATSLNQGYTKGLNEIFSRESIFFEEGKDINIFTANRYFKMIGHRHSYFEIQFVVEGSAVHNPDGNPVYLKKGDIVLVPPDTHHNTQPVESSTIEDLEIRYSTFESTFQDILSSRYPISSYFRNALYGKGPRECIILDDVLDETILNLLMLIWKENRSKTYVSRKKCIHLTEVLLYHLAEIVTQDHIFAICEYQNEEMYQIRSYMIEHMDTVTLADLSEHFHRTDSVISRYIKARSGRGFSELLQNMRLERAADYLLSTAMDISSIGNAVGYAGESHFISCFRKKYGMTPLQYRRRNTRSGRD